MKNILIIDDDKDLCSLLERELKKKISIVLYAMMDKQALMLLKHKIISL